MNEMGMGMAKEDGNVWEGYSPSDYENLNIGKDVSDLFKYITEYLLNYSIFFSKNFSKIF